MEFVLINQPLDHGSGRPGLLYMQGVNVDGCRLRSARLSKVGMTCSWVLYKVLSH